jgi:hypothetical protein
VYFKRKNTALHISANTYRDRQQQIRRAGHHLPLLDESPGCWTGPLPRASAKAPDFSHGDEAPPDKRIDKVPHLRYNIVMKQSTGFRLTPEARALLDAMSKESGISHTAMLELLIREGAKKRGVRADRRIQAESEQRPTRRD